MTRENRLFIDIDSNSTYLWSTDRYTYQDIRRIIREARRKIRRPRGLTALWDDLLELVRMEALRLGRTYPLGRRAKIMRSDNGWYIRYDEARLSKEEEESLMHESKGHFGHIRFSTEIHDTTLRVSAKARKGSTPPRLREVVMLCP